MRAAATTAQQLRSKIETELKRTVDALEKALRDDVENIERETQRQKTEGKGRNSKRNNVWRGVKSV